MYELFSSLGDVPRTPDDKRPDWAIQAWREFWRTTGIFSQEGTELPDLKSLGSAIGLVTELQVQHELKLPDAQKLADAVNEAVPHIKEAAAKEPPETAAAFFVGQKNGAEQVSRVIEPSQRAKLLLFIAVLWEEFSAFKSTRELYQWFVTHELIQPPGSLTGKGGTDPREIRKICRMIGLRYSESE